MSTTPMKVKFTKERALNDSVECVRADGSRTRALMPHQGIMPHDLFHFVVESTLEMRAGLYGHIARGCELRFDDDLNPSRIDAYGKVELAQSESLVECLQAESWGGTVPFEQFIDVLTVTCSTRDVQPPVLTSEKINCLRHAVASMSQRWEVLPVGASLELEF
jgi:hypothetical protein